MNVPLKDGMDDDNYKLMFEPIMTKVHTCMLPCKLGVPLMETHVCADRDKGACTRGVILAQGPCKVSLSRSNFNIRLKGQRCMCICFHVSWVYP